LFDVREQPASGGTNTFMYVVSSAKTSLFPTAMEGRFQACFMHGVIEKMPKLEKKKNKFRKLLTGGKNRL